MLKKTKKELWFYFSGHYQGFIGYNQIAITCVNFSLRSGVWLWHPADRPLISLIFTTYFSRWFRMYFLPIGRETLRKLTHQTRTNIRCILLYSFKMLSIIQCIVYKMDENYVPIQLHMIYNLKMWLLGQYLWHCF